MGDGRTIELRGRGAPGRKGDKGDASGPLGFESVGAEEISSDTTEVVAIRNKIGAASRDDLEIVEARLLTPEWARVLKKLRLNSAVTFIDAQGDSNTYGQSGDGSAGPRAPINGSDHYRLNHSWPETLSLALNLIYNAIGGNPAVTVNNRGYPGDTVVTSFDRWKNVTVADARLFLFGTNDENKPISEYIEGYRIQIEWALKRGEAVGIVLPFNGDGVGNQGYRLYADAARDLAENYTLPYFDANECLQQIRGVSVAGSDGLHLTEDAQQQLGWDTTTLFMPWGATNCLKVAPGTRIEGLDWASPSGNYDAQPASRSGRVANIDPGKVFAIAVDCVTDVVPMVEMWNNAANSQTAFVKFSGGQQVGVVVSPGTDFQPFSSKRNKQPLSILRKGKRLLLLHNQTAANAQIDAIPFDAPTSVFDPHGWEILPEMANTAVTKIGLSEVWSFARANKSFPKITAIKSRVKLGANKEQGIAGFANSDATRNFGNANQIALMRFGASLFIRRIIDGVKQSDVVLSTSVFAGDASNTVEGELAMVFNGTTVAGYFNGIQVGGTVPYTNRNLFPAWVVNDQDLTFTCQSMSVLETV